jgi:hypothetical protein
MVGPKQKNTKQKKEASRARDPHVVFEEDQVAYMHDLKMRSGFSKSKCYRAAIDWFIASFAADFSREYGVDLGEGRLKSLDIVALRKIIGRQLDAADGRSTKSAARKSKRSARVLTSGIDR